MSLSEPQSDPQNIPEGGAAQSAEDDLNELREAVLDDWLRVTSSVTDAVREMQSTLSWRITRPLRLVRMVQRKVDEFGVVPAAQLSAAAIAKRLGR
ncbi:hypothetical protein GCM10025867_37540 [Frondihabitans sucicola]|uniref:DUF222 domain-containing protein n=1 Tax=Frondihabitans sucicola TaxID=1268041 RepID=A0ABM8GT91_9MICO|nr:hypothetical protein [Frondihabitans sucicola]BDZ51513.1 hypothetical protein GCM10025867_37540 [Frondihabitans sucicola]